MIVTKYLEFETAGDADITDITEETSIGSQGIRSKCRSCRSIRPRVHGCSHHN